MEGRISEYESILLDVTTYLIITCTKLVTNGDVVALKGMGGYHLICDAKNEKTIQNLRINKAREAKPFAVMCREIAAIEKYCLLK